MKKNVFTASLLICIAFQILVPGIKAAEVCEWNFRSCPEDIHGQVITVPERVIALSPNIRACNAETQMTSADTAAIMFIIDNSTSMSSTGMGRGNDVQGLRFSVTRDLLDTIYQSQPSSWVGLVVFRAGLYFDKNSYDIFEPLEGIDEDSPYPDQAYLPPLKLDSTYNFDGREMKGIDILKFLLQTTNPPRQQAVQLLYEPGFRMTQGTNINDGFGAALQGLDKIPTDRISKKSRFIVFLSDGEPTDSGGKPLYYFKQGLNTPTTFTVFLHNSLTAPPDSLVEMTENIRNNGYSENNPKSDIWITKADNRDSVMSLFMNNVMNVIISKKSGQPIIMQLNGKVSTTFSDSAFKFDDDFAISNDTTEFTLEVTWRMIDAETGNAYDSSATNSFKIVRSKVNQPSEGYLDCWERDLILQYDGKPISAVNETMNRLEVVFTTNSNKYKSVKVDITHSTGSVRDTIWNLQLVEGASGFSGFFDRAIGSPQRDNILQHADPDSIILIYRNPDNPLDTIRKAYPFSISKILKFPAAYYYDSNADGKVDSIFIEVEGVVAEEDLEKLKSSITLPGPRKFNLNSISIVTGGIALKVNEQNSEIKTYVTPTDVITVNGGTLPAGGLIEGNIINVQDRVAPVLMSGTFFSDKQDSLQVEFSEPIDQFSSKEPILFSHNGNVYRVILEENGIFSKERFYTSKVTSVQSGFAITEGDLIWINPVAKIGDTLDVKQLNPENRKVPIKVRESDYNIRVKTVNNPMRPDKLLDQKIYDIIVNEYAKKGKPIPPQNGLYIVVEPSEDIKNKIKMEGSITIYDVVKNLIKKDIEGVFSEELQKLFYFWDGKSENKRKVGTGTYTASIRVTTISEKTNRRKTTVQKVPLGILRK